MKNKIFALSVIVAFGFLARPGFAKAATLFLSPSSGNYSVGQTFAVSVRVNTQGAMVNTAEAHLIYSADTLDVVSIGQGSTFYLPAPSSPSKATGKVYFGGGLPTPGYNGTSGLLGTMTFKAKATGVATVGIASGSVLLNDGFGTNALSTSSGASFNIVAAPPAKPQEPTPTPQPVFEPTKPVQPEVAAPPVFIYRTVTMPMYLIFFINLVYLLLLIFVFWLAGKRRRKSNTDSEIRIIQDDIDASLENLKHEINQKLLGLTAKSPEELFEKEAVMAKQLRGGIVKTRKKIDKNISRLKNRRERIKDEI